MRQLARCIMTLVAWMAVGTDAKAQHNPYRLNDELYPIYRRAYLNRHDSLGLLSADTLMRKAKAMGDKKGQMMALTIPYYFSYSNDSLIEDFDRVLNPMQDFALANGFLSYYYNGVTNRVSFLINKKYMKEAGDYLGDRYDFAKKNNHHIGVYNALLQLAALHRHQGRSLLAIKTLEDAIDYAARYMPRLDLTNAYCRLGDAYDDDGNYEKELEVSNLGLMQTKKMQARLILLRNKAKALFMLHRDKEFLVVNQQLQQYPERHGRIVDLAVFQIEAMEKAVMGRYDEAYEILDDKRLERFKSTFELIIEICRRDNNWKRMVVAQRKLLDRNMVDNERLADTGLLEINARYNNQVLETERRNVALRHAQLKLNNSKLSLHNSNLELSRVKASERMTVLNMNRLQLEYEKKQIEAQRLRDSIRLQHEVNTMDEKDKNRRENFLWAVLGVGILVVLVLTVYYRNRLSLTRKLNEANRQMAELNKKLEKANGNLHASSQDVMEAKNRAETANRMKTLFIQNMSHEVRTPLNAIVGFSQLMAEMGSELSAEELADMSHRIADNSSLLLTLINDIIDLTNVESGRYCVKMAEAKPNSICRMALAIVEHRKAEDVKLVMHSDAPDDFTIVTDSERVAQVLINLLTNAEKNTEHGTITLDCSVHSQPGHVVFTVTDTGVGIPVDKMDVIFERFTKLDNFKQGSGLGLNICSTIAQKLKGHLSIDRTYHNGARFIFVVPQDGEAVSGGGNDENEESTREQK